jgi:hypothetical protein
MILVFMNITIWDPKIFNYYFYYYRLQLSWTWEAIVVKVLRY